MYVKKNRRINGRRGTDQELRVNASALHFPPINIYSPLLMYVAHLMFLETFMNPTILHTEGN